MKRKYYFNFLISIIVIIFISYLCYNSPFFNPAAKVKSFKDEWGLELPRASTAKELIGTDVSFLGDGAWYIIYHYNKNISLESTGMIEVDTKNIDYYQNKIDYFFELLENINNKADPNNFKLDVGDYVFYGEENGSYDFLIAIYRESEKNLYTLKWYQ